MKTIYLCGPMNNVAPVEAIQWRRIATKVLTGCGYKILDPTVDKDLYDPEINTTVFTPEQIIGADLEMIDQSDALLVDISRDCPCWGSAMEVRYAYEKGKKIFTWGRFNYESYWIRYHATLRFESLFQALGNLRRMSDAGH